MNASMKGSEMMNKENALLECLEEVSSFARQFESFVIL